MKKLLITVLFILIAVLAVAVFKFNFMPLPVEKLKIEKEETYPASYQLKNVPDQFLRQTPYDCGEFNAMFALQVLGKPVTKEYASEEIKKSKIRKLGILPETLVNFFQVNYAEAYLNTTKHQSPEQQIETLKEILSKGKPVIVLVKRHGYLHYVTIVGYNKTHFHVYDPMIARDGDSEFTQDLNGDLVGNDSITPLEFLKLWNQGNVMGVYKNVLIQFD